jgi:hypothetical protein
MCGICCFFRGVLLEKLTLAQRLINFPPFMEVQGSFPCSPKSTTGFDPNDNMLSFKVVTGVNQEDICEHRVHTGLKQRQGLDLCVLHHANSISSFSVRILNLFIFCSSGLRHRVVW